MNAIHSGRVKLPGTDGTTFIRMIAALTARRGRPTAWLRKPLAVMALMALARGLLFPLLWLGNRTGHGDCLLRVARRG